MTSASSDLGALRPPRRASRLAAAAAVATWAPAVAGLAVSAMLAVDYAHAVPVFCSEASGCAAVRRSVFASFFGVPTPIFGLIGFAVLGGASLLSGRVVRAAHAGIAAIAAVLGALLFFAQVMLGHFCPYCCVADGCAVLCAVAAVVRDRVGPVSVPRPVRVALASAGTLGLALAGVVPFAIGEAPRAVPAVIRREQQGAAPGQATIVDFVDFECPFCRITNAALEPMIEAHRARIHLVRRQVPLRIHPHARDAARAACCGEQLGKGDAMADALFSAPPDDLTPSGCEALAERLGLPLEAYRACVAAPATDARIDADRAEFNDAGGEALPTLWIGDQEIVGAQPAAALEKALDDALRRPGR